MNDRGTFRGLPRPMLAAAEIALNRYLGADQSALDRAARLAGASLTLRLSDLGRSLTFIAERHGMQVTDWPDAEPDVCLTGRSTAFARVFFAGGRSGLAGSGLRIEGDIDIAQRFADLFAAVDFNLGDVLDARFGPIAGGLLERGARSATGLLSRLRQELPAQAAEYLREETGYVIGSWEHDEFAREVEAFRDDVERLGARLRPLERRR